ncbi:hypothetical protein M426DRAFT_15005 [Hypoxylon sp. CI-4A]|nr:hypothetical protein M426DRAFT_15005 [Hypoxylon sp. CI-4A]
MAPTPSSEGYIPFKVPGENNLTCSAYYKVFGDISSGRPPVVLLHGGPGGGHEYLLPFAELWPRYGLPIVLYDQIGCGASTHLPQMAGNAAFWQESLFVNELNNLIDHLKLRDGPGFHLLGQSWGGMLGTAFATTRPPGLRRLVLASAVATMDLCAQSIDLCRSKLRIDVRKAIEKCVQEGDYESPAYHQASAVFSRTFVCRVDPAPAELVASMQHLLEDRTVYGTMYGPSVFDCSGSLRSSGWTSIPRLPQITAPTLVYNGEYDTSHDISQKPFFELIPRVRWITFNGRSHMCHLDGDGLSKRVLEVVGDFLTQHEGS